MGYGCRNARLHWLAGSFEMREVELQMAFPIYMNNDRFAKKLNEVKYHASAGLELSPQVHYVLILCFIFFNVY